MKQKKVLGYAALAVIIGGLAGCGLQQAQSKQASAEAHSVKQVAESSKATSSTEQTSHQVKNTTVAATSTSKASQHASSSAGSATPAVDNRTVGLMLWMQLSTDYFKEYIADGTLYYQASDSSGVAETQGYSVVDTHGDPMGYVYYKVNGNKVTYKRWTAGENVAAGHFVTQTIPISQLISQYDATAAQQADMQRYLSQLKTDSD